MVYPLTNEDMLYDQNMHVYILTPEYVARMTGEDLYTRLNTRGLVDRTAFAKNFLKNVSRVVYSFIYSNKSEKFFREYLLAKHEGLYPIIKDALLEQCIYTLSNGDISKLSGLDIRRGALIDRTAMRKVMISPVVEDLLNQEFDQNLPCILYRGKLDIYQDGKEYPRYKEEWY